MRRASGGFGRRGALVAPQTFPTADKACQEASAAVGARLPAEPRSTLRGLYLTQWIECGGADKGMIDLLTRVDPTVIDLLQDPARREAMGRSATKRVRENFGLDVMVSAYEALYHQLARRP